MEENTRGGGHCLLLRSSLVESLHAMVVGKRMGDTREGAWREMREMVGEKITQEMFKKPWLI